MIVLDASAAIDLLLDTSPFAETVADHLSEHAAGIHSPHLLDAEVGEVLRRHALKGDIHQRRVEQALDHLLQLPITRYPHGPFLKRALRLGRNLTAYDGLYVALAEALDLPLLTRDRRLARAAKRHASMIVV